MFHMVYDDSLRNYLFIYDLYPIFPYHLSNFARSRYSRVGRRTKVINWQDEPPPYLSCDHYSCSPSPSCWLSSPPGFFKSLTCFFSLLYSFAASTTLSVYFSFLTTTFAAPVIKLGALRKGSWGNSKGVEIGFVKDNKVITKVSEEIKQDYYEKVFDGSTPAEKLKGNIKHFYDSQRMVNAKFSDLISALDNKIKDKATIVAGEVRRESLPMLLSVRPALLLGQQR